MNADAAPAAGADPFDLPRLCQFFSEQSPQAMVAVEGPTHVVRYLNPAFARLSGRPAEALVGRPFAEAAPTGAGCADLLDRVFGTGAPETLAEQAGGQTPSACWSYSAWAITGPAGRPVGVMVQVTDAAEAANFRAQARAMNESLVIAAVRQHELIDAITQGEQERRDLEARMFQAQKMESLGVLAGGLAHDLNNMLTPVLGYAELAAAFLPADSPAGPMLDEVATNTRRAADLVNQILAYAGKGRFVVEPVDLSALVAGMGALLGSAVSVNTRLTFALAPGLPAVEADATQLRQVVMNLVKNASEAGGDAGGDVTVRTGLSPADHRAPKGPAVFLEVTDSGSGMTPDVMAKIFDPFFTTKFTGRGLGLAVVHGVVRGHGGDLQIRSEPGHGSTFRFTLPCSAKAVAAPVVLATVAGWRGTGTVLVVDDEPSVRDVAARVLRHAGLTVLTAADGLEGVTVFRESGQEIDAVVLDLTMPGMGGRDAAAALRELRPGLPVVLMSGFSASEVALQSAGLGLTEFVQKPFTAPDLLAAVRHALGQ